jgi:hypothetical protein
MWKIEGVPKICHIYWGGKTLPYMRLLTFKSFLKYNPDWEIWLWTSTNTVDRVTWASLENDYPLMCNNFLPVLDTLPLKRHVLDFVELGFAPDMAEVHKADYVRITAMYEYGGAWVDSDIIFFRPMEHLSVNNDSNIRKEVFVSICKYGHSVGFLMAKPKSRFYKRLNEVMLKEFNYKHYQCIGSVMFDKYFPPLQPMPDGAFIHDDAVYRYDANHVKELMTYKEPWFNDESIGCHWYGGNTLWVDFIRKTNGGFMNVPNTVIGKVIKYEVFKD